MALFYLCCGVVILLLNIDMLIPAFKVIFSDAFTGKAAAGGAMGVGY